MEQFHDHCGSPLKEQELAFCDDLFQYCSQNGSSSNDLDSKTNGSYNWKIESWQTHQYQQNLHQYDPNSSSPSMPEFNSTCNEFRGVFDSNENLDLDDSMEIIQMRSFKHQEETKEQISKVLSRITKIEGFLYKVQMSDSKIIELTSLQLEKEAPQLKDMFDKELQKYIRDTQMELINMKHSFANFEIRNKKKTKGSKVIVKTLESSKSIPNRSNNEEKIKRRQPSIQKKCSMKLRCLRKQTYSTSTISSLKLLSESSNISNNNNETFLKTVLSAESSIIIKDGNKEQACYIQSETTLEKKENQLDTIIECLETEIPKVDADQFIECEIELNPSLFEIEGNPNHFTPLRIIKEITKRNPQRTTRSSCQKQQSERSFLIEWQQCNGITVSESGVSEKIMLESFPEILSTFLKTHQTP